MQAQKVRVHYSSRSALLTGRSALLTGRVSNNASYRPAHRLALTAQRSALRPARSGAGSGRTGPRSTTKTLVLISTSMPSDFFQVRYGRANLAVPCFNETWRKEYRHSRGNQSVSFGNPGQNSNPDCLPLRLSWLCSTRGVAPYPIGALPQTPRRKSCKP